MHITDRVEAKPFWNSLLHQLDQGRDYRLWLVPLDKMEIGIRLCSAHVRHLSSADAVCVGDDLAVRRLPEHFREAHGRHDTALDQVMRNRARTNGRKLVYVADKNQPGAVGNRPQKRVHQRHVHH